MRAPERAHHRLRTKLRGDIPCKRADIRAPAATDLKAEGVFRLLGFAQKLHVKHLYFFRRERELHARASQIVPTLSVHVFRAVFGRDLHQLPDKFRQNGADLLFAGNLSAVNHLARAIEGIRRNAEGKFRDIFLLLVQKIIEKAGGVANADGQDTACERVERAHVPAGQA